MAGVILNGDTSGSISVVVPAVAGSNIITVPASTGTMALTTDVIGVNQTWQAVTGSRAAGTTYTNSTGKPIAVSINMTDLAGNATATLTVSGVVVISTHQGSSVGYQPNVSCVIPSGATYLLTLTNYAVSTWNELR